MIDEVGYHCRDYFVEQWDTFKDFPEACSRTRPT